MTYKRRVRPFAASAIVGSAGDRQAAKSKEPLSFDYHTIFMHSTTVIDSCKGDPCSTRSVNKECDKMLNCDLDGARSPVSDAHRS